MKAPALSGRQQQVLDILVAAHLQRKRCPSIGELAKAMEVSPASVLGYLHAMERKGWIHRPTGEVRAIEVRRGLPPECECCGGVGYRVQDQRKFAQASKGGPECRGPS